MTHRRLLPFLVAAAPVLLQVTRCTAQERVVITLTGSITDRARGVPIPSVTVELNGNTIAVTDTNGAFRVSDIDVLQTGNVMAVRRIGYEELDYEFSVPEGESTLDLNFALREMAVPLEEITAEAERSELVSRRLAGFFRRRDAGFGHFFTTEDIEKIRPPKVSDALRRVPGVQVNLGGASRGIAADGRIAGTETQIFFHRGGGGTPGTPRSCGANVFVDGVRLVNTDLDLFATPDRVAGIEVYTSIANAPAEYNVAGSRCGVVLVWTGDPIRSPSPFAIGFHVGANVVGDGLTARRIGGQIVIPVFGPLDLGVAFNLINANQDSNTRSLDSGGQGFVNLNVRPFGRSSPWYVGTGLSLLQRKGGFPGAEEVTGHHVLLTGFALPIGPFRPFAEAHVLDAVGPWDAATYLFTGINLHVSRAPRQ